MEPTNEPVAAASPPNSAAIEAPSLSPLERALFEALASEHQSLANMYLGALEVVRQESNPDRHALVAHGLRELMEKLPRYLDLPAEIKNPQGLRSRANSLIAARDKWSDQAIDGASITTSGRKLLQKLDDFCDGVISDFPSRKEQAANAVRGLDDHPVGLPTSIVELHAAEWDAIHGFFVEVAHHKLCIEEELRQYVSALERFLLERLRPRTFDDFAEIDALLEEDV